MVNDDCAKKYCEKFIFHYVLHREKKNYVSHIQQRTLSWPCSSRAWTFEAGRNSGSLALVLGCQGMMESVMVGRESDMQESPPRGSPHRQACPRPDSHCEALK